MTYIHFTEEQKYRASCVDLVEFLRRQGEKLIRSGPEYRMASDHSVTVRGNEWYDHAAKEGGGPISFVQNYCGLSYPEAVTRLLEGEQGQIYEPAPRKREEPKKEFIQPPVSREMRRVYAYLLKKRLIDREVLSTFVWAGLIYEDEKYHNAVFAGKDEHGVVRHAHKRSTSDIGKTFRINVEGSDPRYSFHWNGTSDRLYNNMAIGMYAGNSGNALYCPTGYMELLRLQDRFVYLPEMPYREVDLDKAARNILSQEQFELDGGEGTVASWRSTVTIRNVHPNTTVAFRMNNLSGSASDLMLYAYGMDGKLAKVASELWSITDETGEAVTELTDGTLYEVRITVADGGELDLSDVEKEIKFSCVLGE